MSPGEAFLLHRVPPPLRGLVGFACAYRCGPMPGGVHRGLPSRHVTLVLDLVAPLHVRGLGDDVAAPAVLGGLHTAPALIGADRPQDGLQLGLTPAGVAVLLGVPAAELRGRAVDVADVLGRATTGELLERVRAAPDPAARLRVVDTALLARLGQVRHAPVRPGPADEAWRVLLATDGRARVGDLARHVGWSRRHLSERVRAMTGLTPKEVARVARFEAARRLLLAPRRPGLADVAATCGYADQQHLSREWRALAGCSPTTWLAEELPFVHDTAALPAAPSPA